MHLIGTLNSILGHLATCLTPVHVLKRLLRLNGVFLRGMSIRAFTDRAVMTTVRDGQIVPSSPECVGLLVRHLVLF